MEAPKQQSVNRCEKCDTEMIIMDIPKGISLCPECDEYWTCHSCESKIAFPTNGQPGGQAPDDTIMSTEGFDHWQCQECAKDEPVSLCGRCGSTWLIDDLTMSSNGTLCPNCIDKPIDSEG